MKRISLAIALLLCSLTAHAQGVIPFALTQQISSNGTPLSGALLYTFVVGTTSSPQNTYKDVGLTQVQPFPLAADSTGRFPMFYVASGSVHARLTDSGGSVLIDIPNLLVIGPASGGGGGGGGSSVDPTSIASTGDIKVRLTNEALSGWVKLNGTTIGNATSGATQLANATTQNLYVYLWTNCPNTHCPVSGGRGGSALSDYQASKPIQLLDMRDKMIAGRDCMDTTCLGGLIAQNVTSPGDTVDTPQATGGGANKSILLSNLPNLSLPTSVSVSTSVSTTVDIPAGQGSHTHTVTGGVVGATSTSGASGGGSFIAPANAFNIGIANQTLPDMSGTGTGSGSGSGTGSATLAGGNVALPIMNPFMLATYYQKL